MSSIFFCFPNFKWYFIKSCSFSPFVFRTVSSLPSQAKSLLHHLEQAARGISLCINSDKTKFVSFNRDSAMSSLNDKPLKLVDQFIYLGSNISSTENDVNICIGRVWTAIDRLTTI